MPRPSQRAEKRAELMPIVARIFAEFGYRRTTTAEIARRCGVQENILYRLWPDKKAMFIAAIDFVYDQSVATWRRLLAAGAGGSAAEEILEYEAKHHGEFGHYRIVFAGLSETDDPDIRAALARMYARFQAFVADQIIARRGSGENGPLEADLVAWTLLGMGTVSNIARELKLLPPAVQERLFLEVGRHLLEETRRDQA